MSEAPLNSASHRTTVSPLLAPHRAATGRLPRHQRSPTEPCLPPLHLHTLQYQQHQLHLNHHHNAPHESTNHYSCVYHYTNPPPLHLPFPPIRAPASSLPLILNDSNDISLMFTILMLLVFISPRICHILCKTNPKVVVLASLESRTLTVTLARPSACSLTCVLDGFF